MKKPSRKPKAAATEPVTLALARAMIAKPPATHAVRAQTNKAESASSLASVGIERKRLRLQRRRERDARASDYKKLMAIMKRRGVKGLPSTKSVRRPSRGTQGTATAPDAGPLQILAEGDSWFDYPAPFFGGGIIRRLEDLLGIPILNLAKAGDEVRFMLGVEERKILAKHLRDGCPAGGTWDVLLFSGGGNDIVDNPMALWVRDFDPAVSPKDLIHQPRFSTALVLVQAGYEDLIALRDSLSPNTRLIFHAYDFAIPDGRGVCFLGPWLKPTFDLRKFPAGSSTAFEVVKEMLTQFAALIQQLQRDHKNVTFINAQGTLAPKPSSWHNELHPAKAGFDQFAKIFHQQIKALFPNRVL